MSIRTEKVAGEIKRTLAKPISDLANEYSAGLVTITAVRISPDLKSAKVYVSLYGHKMAPSTFIEHLESHKGKLRHIVGTQIRLRATPDLKFFIDDTLDQIEHIQRLLDSVKSDLEPRIEEATTEDDIDEDED